MMAALLLITLAGGASANLCSPVVPAEHPNASLAVAYVTVGDEERAAERTETALTAYREALRQDPANTQARAAMLELCRASEESSDDFEEAVRRMESADRQGAIALFRSIRAKAPDPGAALLEAICSYELEDDAAATSALKEAEADPSQRDVVHLFQGLIALREGREAEAAALFRQSSESSDPRLQNNAADLLQLTHRQGRLLVSAQVEVGSDSNVPLSPTGDAWASGNGDGFAGGAAALQWHPWQENGPFIGVSGQYRKQFVLSDFDLAAASVDAGWAFGGSKWSAVGEYAFDGLVYGGQTYLAAHRLQARARRSFDVWSIGAGYSARLEHFIPGDISGYSGLRHAGFVESGWRLPGGVSLDVAYNVGYDATNDASLTYLEHGPRVAVTWRLSPGWRVGLDGALWLRNYQDVGDPVGTRADRIWDGGGFGEYLFAEGWAVRLAVSVRRAFSNVADFTYTKAVGSLGISYTTGLF